NKSVIFCPIALIVNRVVKENYMNQCSSVRLDTLAELTDFVNTKLCEQNLLKLGAFPLTERVLRRRGKPCAMSFCLHGPRMVKFMAIWEANSNRILFYNPSGECMDVAVLISSPVDEFIERFSAQDVEA
ncbi:MAG: hypothetical protein J5787_07055, partial [Alphaproteobacteria bacterium]|nr:hypothetical protein [Alphaproteobacteria bacterium]